MKSLGKDIVLLNEDGSINSHVNLTYFTYELKYLKKYLKIEGFDVLSENFILTFMGRKWLCQPKYFKECETFKEC
jgi:hypothetical protein